MPRIVHLRADTASYPGEPCRYIVCSPGAKAKGIQITQNPAKVTCRRCKDWMVNDAARRLKGGSIWDLSDEARTLVQKNLMNRAFHTALFPKLLYGEKKS